MKPVHAFMRLYFIAGTQDCLHLDGDPAKIYSTFYNKRCKVALLAINSVRKAKKPYKTPTKSKH